METGYLYITSGLDFIAGNCDLCKQKNVKVTPFHCKSHFYCRCCLEFAPKFRRKKDFSCPTCDRANRRDSQRLEEVDRFMRKQTERKSSHSFEEVVFNVGRNNTVSWNSDANVSDDDDDDDLTGSNDVWEKLLQAKPVEPSGQATAEKSDAQTSGTMEKTSSSQRIMGMPPVQSHLQLRVPYADSTDSPNSASASSFSIPRSDKSRMSDVDMTRSSSGGLRGGSKRSKSKSSSCSSVSSAQSRSTDDSNRLEVKGSGTMSGRYVRQTQRLYEASPDQSVDDGRRKRPNTPVQSRPCSSSEWNNTCESGISSECWLDDVGTIEGPSFKDSDITFTSRDYVQEVEKDDFWDM